jgi:peptidoglycan/LPS O-acetylase OafA/YrhL
MKLNHIDYYRRDLDGIRGFAIILVVLFHVFPHYFPSGFIGVDFFFVISGFLIHQNVNREMVNNEFYLTQFYLRRFKRLAPALLLVLIAVLLMSWGYLFSYEYKKISLNVLGGLALIANYITKSQTGYFDQEIQANPLMHLWSLSVEEQFYITFPILMLAIKKYNFNKKLLLILLFISSLVLNILTSLTDQSSAYFLFSNRAWQFLLGSMVSVFAFGVRNYSSMKVKVMSFLAITMITISLLLISKEKAYPGVWVMMSTIGISILIFLGERSWFNNKILGSKLLVGIGLISYPLYLVHWPVYSFIYLLSYGDISYKQSLMIIVISFFTAYAISRLLDEKVKSGKLFKKDLSYLTWCYVLVLTVAFSIYFKNGFTDRSIEKRKNKISSEFIQPDLLFDYIKTNNFECLREFRDIATEVYQGKSRCVQSRENEKPSVIVYGDSHAEDLFLGISEKRKDDNVALFLALRSNIYGDDVKDMFLEYIKKTSRFDTIYITGLWVEKIPSMLNKYQKPYTEMINKFIDEIAPHFNKIIILSDVPSFSFSPIKCANLRSPFNKKFTGIKNCSEGSEVYLVKQQEVFTRLKGIIRPNKKVSFIDLFDSFCKDRACSMSKDGKLAYRDSNHLTLFGAKLMTNFF